MCIRDSYYVMSCSTAAKFLVAAAAILLTTCTDLVEGRVGHKILASCGSRYHSVAGSVIQLRSHQGFGLKKSKYADRGSCTYTVHVSFITSF